MTGKNSTKPQWIPKSTKCNKLGHQQIVHIPSLIASSTFVCLTMFQLDSNFFGSKVHSKSAYPVSIITEMHHWFGTGQASQPLFQDKCKGILNLFQPLPTTPYQSQECYCSRIEFWLFRLFPSYSRKPTLFGHVVSDLREAWQSVSTISRSKLTKHKTSPITTKMKWTSRTSLCMHYCPQFYWGLSSLLLHWTNLFAKTLAHSLLAIMLVQITLKTEVLSSITKTRVTWITLHLTLFLLMVGNLVCLVMLCLISARRDKVCPQYRVRNWQNTKPLQPPQKLSGPLENDCTLTPNLFWTKLIRSLVSYSMNYDVTVVIVMRLELIL
jgi:hypothetical protein